MKTAIVCGAGWNSSAAIWQAAQKEKAIGCAVDIKKPGVSASLPRMNFFCWDFGRRRIAARRLRWVPASRTEVYQLAADMADGFIHSSRVRIMHNSVHIKRPYDPQRRPSSGVKRYFYSHQSGVYRDMKPGEPEMREAEAVPQNQTTNMAGKNYIQSAWRRLTRAQACMVVRIARFQNCYGLKAPGAVAVVESRPAAICRKSRRRCRRRNHRRFGANGSAGAFLQLCG